MSDNQSHLEYGSYFADVLQATSGTEPLWCYILQREGARGIAAFVKFDSWKKPWRQPTGL